MKNSIFTTGARLIAILGIITVSLSGGIEASADTITACDSGESLSYNQAVDAIAWGLVTIDRSPDLGASTASMTVTNNTPCDLSVSLASYKMYEAYSLETLSLQIFFNGTPTVTIAPSTSQTLTVTTPSCMYQYDLWYGDSFQTIPDNHTWGKILSGDQVLSGQYCVDEVVVPVAPVVPVVPVEPVTPVVPAVPVEPATTTPSVELVAAPVATYVSTGGGHGGGTGGGDGGPIVYASTVVSYEPVIAVIPGFPDTGFSPIERGMLLSFSSMIAFFAVGLYFIPRLFERRRVATILLK